MVAYEISNRTPFRNKMVKGLVEYQGIFSNAQVTYIQNIKKRKDLTVTGKATDSII